VWALLAQTKHEPPDVAGPDPRPAKTAALDRMVREDVVDDYEPTPRGPTLSVHEISDGILEEVEAVYEREVDGPADRLRGVTPEEFVACHRVQRSRRGHRSG